MKLTKSILRQLIKEELSPKEDKIFEKMMDSIDDHLEKTFEMAYKIQTPSPAAYKRIDKLLWAYDKAGRNLQDEMKKIYNK